jgi:magnesium chelatase family protein
VLASVRTFTLDGIAAREVQVEVDVHRGLPAFSIVGLPDAAVRESRERVRAALVNCGFEFPLRRITVNLAPADVPKAGPGIDLATAAALLAASGQLPGGLDPGLALAGELALDGAVRPIAGVLAMAEAARVAGLERIVVASANGPEAAVVRDLAVLTVERLDELPELLAGERLPPRPRPITLGGVPPVEPDLSDLRGQPNLRRALEVAAAGGHSVLMIGPPGAGKSLAARRVPSIMPPLGPEEALEVARIASVNGTLNGAGLARPFRAPHHTISYAGLVGGGNPPRAGEVTLAHRGVLFLDELGEFNRAALESLRAPLEEGEVTVTRAGRALRLPCRFMLLAAANPCPCGRGTVDDECSCGPVAVRRYEAKLTGAVADRLDMRIAVRQPSAQALDGEPGEGSETVRARVLAAREIQAERLGAGRSNADMVPAEVRRIRVTPAGRRLLAEQHRARKLSGRGHDRVLRVARTIADLAAAGATSTDHVGEALGMRLPERRE